MQPAHTLLFFNATAPTEIYTLSLHDALPISLIVILDRPGRHDSRDRAGERGQQRDEGVPGQTRLRHQLVHQRSEEHTSELQSPVHLVCRLLLEKKKETLNTSPSRRARAGSVT